MNIPPDLIGRTIRAKERKRREFRIFAAFSLSVGTCLLVAEWMDRANVFALIWIGFVTMVLTTYLLYQAYLLDTLFLVLDQQGLVYKTGKRLHRLDWDELRTVEARWLGLPAYPLKPIVFPSWRLKLNYWIMRFLGGAREGALAHIERFIRNDPRRDFRKVCFTLQGQGGQRLRIIPDEFESPFDRVLKEWLWGVWQEKTISSSPQEE